MGFLPSAFGQTNNANTNAFWNGNTMPATGEASVSFGTSTAFGQTLDANTTSTAFGQSIFGQANIANTNAFGTGPSGSFGTSPASVHNGNQRKGSRKVAYSATLGIEEGEIKFQSLSAMSVYKDKSHEELRLEDYNAGDQGEKSSTIAFPSFSWFQNQFNQTTSYPFPPQSSTGLFFSQTAYNSIFSQNYSSIISSPTSTSLFSSQTASNSIFSQNSSSIISSPTSTSLFSSQTASNSIFSQNSSSIISSPTSTSLFSPQTASNSIFSQNSSSMISPQTSTAGLFSNQTSTGLFCPHSHFNSIPRQPSYISGGPFTNQIYPCTQFETCAICLMSMKPGQGHAIFVAECSHSFHFHCIASNVKHGNQICPICKAKWKDIPFQNPISSNPSSFRPPLPLNLPNLPFFNPFQPNPFTSVFHAPEPSVFDDDDDELIDLPPQPTDDNYVNNNLNFNFRALEVRIFPEIPAVSKSASRENFTVLVHLKALASRNNGNIFRQNSRAPIDLVTVLDVSGSMRGTKLALLKRAMEFVIHHLGPSDRLSIVAFSLDACRILSLRRMTDDGRQAALLAVNNLMADGGTNIFEGLKKGVKILTDRKWKNSVASIMLLSDGQDTYTISNPWVARSNGGDGLRFPVHAFGFGADHDAAMLHSISEGSGGTFSFIENESIIQDAFAQCIGGLLSVMVQELEVVVECVNPNIRLGSIKSGSYKNRIILNQGCVNLGDLYADEKRDFLVTVDIPAANSDVVETQLLKIKCVYRDPITKDSVIFDDPNVLTILRPVVTGDLPISIEVDRQRNRLGATEAISEAKTTAERGDLNGAVIILDNFRKKILESVSAGDPLCVGLEVDLREMQSRMGNRWDYESSGRAYALCGMSSHSSQRATAIGGSAGSMAFGQAAYVTPAMANMVNQSQAFSKNSALP